MKKLIGPFVLAFGIFSFSLVAGMPSDVQGAEQELRPMQKIMQARIGWVKAMNSNLGAMNYDEIKKDALALSSQAAAVAEKQPEGLAKELTVRLSTLASATAEATGRKNNEAIQMKLAEIQATCAECHAKIRDKK